jgi:hypothetical protein
MNICFPLRKELNGNANVRRTRRKALMSRKRLKIVENHHDDCGTDLSGLGTEEIDTLLSYEANYDSDEDNVSGMNTHWFKGSDWENDFCTEFVQE